MSENSAMNSCSVYGLFSSFDGEIRYIGQTKRPITKRLAAHLSHAGGGGQTHRAAWIRSVLRDGGEVLPVVLCEEAIWNTTEIEYIAAYRALGARLVNATSGGDGTRNMPRDVREKIGAKARGRVVSAATRAKMSARLKASGIPPEQKARMAAGVARAFRERKEDIGRKLSAALTGRPVSPQTRRRISASLAGNVRPESVRQKLSDANRKRFVDPAERAKTSAATRAAMQCPEVAERLSASAVARWARPENKAMQSARLTAYFQDSANRAAQSERKGSLTAAQVAELRGLRDGGMKLSELSARYGLAKSTICQICKGQRYAHLARDAAAFARAGL